MNLEDYIRNVPNFPIEGIQFKDVTTLCKAHAPFKESCDRLVSYFKDKGITKVCAVEARGYIWGGVLAYQLEAGFVLIRKPGKLPAEKFSESYELEYLLATGGTTKAAITLIEKAGGIIEGIAFVIELTGSLHGRDKLEGYDIISLIEIPVEE